MPKKNSKTVLPDPLPKGEVLQDLAKKKWTLGPSIGVGGFGEIYAAAEAPEASKKVSNYDYVIKIEPHDNGPLFCEMHFFVRCAKPEMIESWCTANKVTSLGLPRYLGSGSHEHKGKKYRFLVMDRYGKDLWHIFLENKRQFPIPIVYRIALQLIDVLEYIHSVGYVHADIKGANILKGYTKQTENQVFLVDYGLVCKYTKKDFQPDPKKAHNGTIEYTSRDAHDGVPTRRGDIEILAYNMIQWMGTTLPWENCLNNPVEVQTRKKKYMSDTTDFLKTCFGKKTVPGALKEFLNYVKSMEYDTEPDYKKLRTILTKGIKNEGVSLTSPLEFKISKHKSDTDIGSPTPEKRSKLTPKNKSRGKATRKSQKPEETTETDSENEEIPVKVSRGKKIKETVEIEAVANGYTAEMLRLQKKIAERKAGKKTVKKPDSSSSANGMNLKYSEEDVIEGTPPEKLLPRKKKKTQSNGNAEKELTPRSLRAMKRQ